MPHGTILSLKKRFVTSRDVVINVALAHISFE